VVVVVGLAVAGTSWFLFNGLQSELTPTEDRGYMVGIAIAPEGATLDYTDRYAKRIEAIYASVPEVSRYFMVVGFPVVNQAIGFALFKPWEQRDRSVKDVVAAIGGSMFGIPGILAFPVNPPSLGQSPIEQPVNFVILTARSYDALNGMLERFLVEARKIPGVINLDSDLKLNKPELKVQVDRDKAADLGISLEDMGRGIETLLGGREVTRFKRDGKQYEVIVQVADVDRRNPDALETIFARGRDGVMVPLSNIVTVQESVAPRELNHFNKLRSATVTATLAPETSLGEALAALEDAARRTLPPDALIDYGGQSREFKESSAGLYVTFLLALAFIYLVLAAQFESFIDPFIIMLTVPLSLTGALLALNLTGGSMNIYSQIGLVTLVGLITKHGILLVEFANQLREDGEEMVAAVIESATLRLRPILMTTGAMVLGAVPLAVAEGAGGESRQQIGWVIVGGLLLGTLFTLFVVPTAYTYLARRRRAAPAAEAQGSAAE
jgi:multidrug efflux pump